MPETKEYQLMLFREKVVFYLETYSKKMKIFAAEEGLAGTDAKELKIMINDPESGWAKEREALNKDIKRAVAGLVNQIHIQAVQDGLK